MLAFVDGEQTGKSFSRGSRDHARLTPVVRADESTAGLHVIVNWLIDLVQTPSVRSAGLPASVLAHQLVATTLEVLGERLVHLQPAVSTGGPQPWSALSLSISRHRSRPLTPSTSDVLASIVFDSSAAYPKLEAEAGPFAAAATAVLELPLPLADMLPVLDAATSRLVSPSTNFSAYLDLGDLLGTLIRSLWRVVRRADQRLAHSDEMARGVDAARFPAHARIIGKFDPSRSLACSVRPLPFALTSC
jgi:hypothetical protein